VYRYQFHAQVQMAHWRDFHALLDELNAALRAKGLVPFQLWEAAFGRFNDALMVAEYETLEAYEREHFALHADAACMNLWREMETHADGIPWTDLWWRPSETRLTPTSERDRARPSRSGGTQIVARQARAPTAPTSSFVER
jgi:hypothetical protein